MYVKQYNDPEFITETWLYKDEINYYNIEQYKPYFNCREKRGGGSALYVRNDIKHKSLLLTIPDNANLVGIRLEKFKFNVYCIYRAPKNDFNTFCKYLENLLEKNN